MAKSFVAIQRSELGEPHFFICAALRPYLSYDVHARGWHRPLDELTHFGPRESNLVA